MEPCNDAGKVNYDRAYVKLFALTGYFKGVLPNEDMHNLKCNPSYLTHKAKRLLTGSAEHPVRAVLLVNVLCFLW